MNGWRALSRAVGALIWVVAVGGAVAQPLPKTPGMLRAEEESRAREEVERKLKAAQELARKERERLESERAAAEARARQAEAALEAERRRAREAEAAAKAAARVAEPSPPRPVALQDLPVIDGWDAARVKALQAEAARAVGSAVEFGDPFLDGSGSAPRMVVIPGARFTIGSGDEERRRYVAAGARQEWADWEKPRAGVPVAAFALGKTEVTRGQFAAFVRATGRVSAGGCHVWSGTDWKLDAARDWRNPGFEQKSEEEPVVCVSWDDGQAYAAWLSQKTGKRYRLASEAEWELAARAGTTTRRYWGDDWDDRQQCDYANGADQTFKLAFPGGTNAPCADGHVYTAPAGRKRANALGLHDMLGNAWEWTQDCFHASYAGMPLDGKAWESGCEDASRRVLRGGSWYINPWILRAASRVRVAAGYRSGNTGLRIARTLP